MKTACNPLPSIVILVSGGGGLMRQAIEQCRRADIPAEIALVISSKAHAPAVRLAQELGLPTAIVEPRGYPGPEEFSAAVWQEVEKCGRASHVLMLGWMPFLNIPDRWANRVVNAHPSLLPQFGGKGMYGRRVHEAVVAAGVRVTGLTFHLADNRYDHGTILHQSAVEVAEDDTVEALQARVVAAQHAILPEFLKAWVSGEMRIQNGHVLGAPRPRWFAALNQCPSGGQHD